MSIPLVLTLTFFQLFKFIMWLDDGDSDCDLNLEILFNFPIRSLLTV